MLCHQLPCVWKFYSRAGYTIWKMYLTVKAKFIPKAIIVSVYRARYRTILYFPERIMNSEMRPTNTQTNTLVQHFHQESPWEAFLDARLRTEPPPRSPPPPSPSPPSLNASSMASRLAVSCRLRLARVQVSWLFGVGCTIVLVSTESDQRFPF